MHLLPKRRRWYLLRCDLPASCPSHLSRKTTVQSHKSGKLSKCKYSGSLCVLVAPPRQSTRAGLKQQNDKFGKVAVGFQNSRVEGGRKETPYNFLRNGEPRGNNSDAAYQDLFSVNVIVDLKVFAVADAL